MEDLEQEGIGIGIRILAALTTLDHTVAMRIAFIDFIGWDYTPQTPRERPLGGTQSGLCYLAEQLALAGHEVFLNNNTQELKKVRGVHCIPITMDGNKLRELYATIKADAVIVLSATEAALQLRPWLPVGTRLYLWTGHAANQPHHEGLGIKEQRDAWNGYVFMGQWQLETVAQKYSLDFDKCVNLGMAVAPPFERAFGAGESLIDTMSDTPTLVYTSTPFRGLEVLVKAFTGIQERIPNVRLRVFSSMGIYQVGEGEDQFHELYQTCRETRGIEYVGPVPQPQLARELKSASMLAYSNVFAETACVAMMEAMASGCAIVSSHLGALPETTAGYATLLREPVRSEEYHNAFVDTVATTLEALLGSERSQYEKHLQAQVAYCLEHYTWAKRAVQWAEWLEQMATVDGESP